MSEPEKIVNITLHIPEGQSFPMMADLFRHLSKEELKACAVQAITNWLSIFPTVSTLEAEARIRSQVTLELLGGNIEPTPGRVVELTAQRLKDWHNSKENFVLQVQKEIAEQLVNEVRARSVGEHFAEWAGIVKESIIGVLPDYIKEMLVGQVTTELTKSLYNREAPARLVTEETLGERVRKEVGKHLAVKRRSDEAKVW